MRRLTNLRCGEAATLLAMTGIASAQAVELQWWHAMTAANAALVNQIAADFNAAQNEYKVVPVFRALMPRR
jgi:sn-glycerol 3-phosphate transport system substrate-binding protein